MLDHDMGLQRGAKVVKPDDEIDNDRRIKAVESQISEIKSFLLLNEGDKLHKNEKEDELNGLGRIRTGDLRRVKTGVLAVFEAFSAGDISGEMPMILRTYLIDSCG